MLAVMRGRTHTFPAAPTGEFESRRPPVTLLGTATGADSLPITDILAFSIPEFCRRHGISRAHFYNLSKNGYAPAVMRVGRRTLISAEAAAEWRRRMEGAARAGERRGPQ
jgi:predicted DNA-binding transcriptional regulator AlpA